MQQDLKEHLMLVYTDWQKNDALAVLAVNENLANIQEFLTAKLEMPETEGPHLRIILIAGIEEVKVVKAKTPAPWTMHDGDAVTITAELELRIHAKVSQMNPWVYPPPRVLKVRGESKPETTFTSFSNSESEEDLVKPVKVEMTAAFNKGRFSDVRPVSISLNEKAVFSKLGSSFYGTP